MTRRKIIIHIAVYEYPHGLRKAISCLGFLHGEQSEVRGSAGMTERGGRVHGVQVPRYREDERHNVRFAQLIPRKQFIIQGHNLCGNVIRIVTAAGCAP
jgi:hypothetical protein